MPSGPRIGTISRTSKTTLFLLGKAVVFPEAPIALPAACAKGVGALLAAGVVAVLAAVLATGVVALLAAGVVALLAAGAVALLAAVPLLAPATGA